MLDFRRAEAEFVMNLLQVISNRVALLGLFGIHNCMSLENIYWWQSKLCTISCIYLVRYSCIFIESVIV